MNWPLSQLPERLVSIDYAQALIIQNKLLDQGCAPRSINRAMMAIRGIVKAAVITQSASQQQYLNLQSLHKITHHPRHPDTQAIHQQ